MPENVTEENVTEEDISFAELFESSQQTPGFQVSPGERVTGTVVKISKETVFIDLGGKSEGTADIQEFRDAEGNLEIKEGDEVQLRVSSVRRGIHLSKAIKARGAEAIRLLEEARRNQVPVEGRVAAVNKGGFDIDLSGTRAFCPISQIDVRYCEKPEEHVGARYPFRIMELGERGRNIILSRRVLLQEEEDKKAKETLARIQPDMELEGRVTRVADFGAFVDIGGLDGMVHVSELSRARVEKVSEFLEQGQVVKVKVLRIETDKKGRPRISLSMKALEPEAWDQEFAFREGDVISGKISRLMDFGAFVEIAPGIEGLVHVSEISYQRVSHPNKVLKEGEDVRVLVLKIDRDKRRVSLSIKDVQVKEQMGGEGEQVRLEPGQTLKGIVEDHKPYGLFVRLPQFGMDVRGLLPTEELLDTDKGDARKKLPRGAEIQVEILTVEDRGKIRLSQRALKDRADREDYARFMEKRDTPGTMGTLGEIFGKLKK